MPFSYANPASGPSAGGIGWFNFNIFSTISPGQTITGLTGTLNDGTIVTFDLTAVNVAGGPRAFSATTVPTYVGAMFGTAGYTGLSGNVALDTILSLVPGSNELIFSNIVVKDSLGNPVPNYTVVVADAESTGDNESWVWQTNGGNWNLLTKLGPQTSPTHSARPWHPAAAARLATTIRLFRPPTPPPQAPSPHRKSAHYLYSRPWR